MKDWCIDAVDHHAVGAFWAELLGLAAVPHPTRPTVVGLWHGDRPVIWVNQVPEAKTVKNRVHPDLHVPDVQRVLDLGATHHSEQESFTVLQDPEGNEMCAFPGGDPDGPPATVFAWCTDSATPVEVAAWWAGRTGASIVPGPDGTLRYLEGVPGMGGVTWKFVPVDDERVGDNRVHWDVTGSVADLLAAGATHVRDPDDDIAWTVLRDPDQNVFCTFTP